VRSIALINTTIPKRTLLLFGFLCLFIQSATATIFYVNDNTVKGDRYTTVVGNDMNDGISSATPKLSIHAAYEKAQDGDTIIIDTGSYAELSDKNELLFTVLKKIKFVIAGFSDTVFAKTPLPTNIKVNPAEIYIDKDKPTDRETYLQQLQIKKTKKSQ
jgi:hypothetical protein